MCENCSVEEDLFEYGEEEDCECYAEGCANFDDLVILDGEVMINNDYTIMSVLNANPNGAVNYIVLKGANKMVFKLYPFLSNDRIDEIYCILDKIGNSRNLLHPEHIITYQNHDGFITKYYPNGDLHEFLRHPELTESLSKRDIINIMRDIAMTVFQIHEKGFVHGCLNLENILLHRTDDNKLIPVISGLSHLNYEQTELNVNEISSFYHDKTVQESHICTQESDVYSLGAIFYLLLTKSNPDDSPEIFTLDQVPSSSISEDALDLLRPMLNPLPENRLKLSNIINAPLFNDPDTKPSGEARNIQNLTYNYIRLISEAPSDSDPASFI